MPCSSPGAAVTGEQRIVVVQLESHEQCDALWTWITNGLDGPGGPDGCVVCLHASNHALSGLSSDWEVQPSEIQRIKALH